MSDKLTEEQVVILLESYKGFKVRTDILENTIIATGKEKEEYISSTSFTMGIKELPQKRTKTDKTCSIALSLSDYEEKIRSYREEVTAIDNAAEQLQAALKGLSIRQRYVVRERHLKPSATRWYALAMNAADSFEDCSERTLQYDLSSAVSQMAVLIRLSEKNYTLAVGQEERQSP